LSDILTRQIATMEITNNIEITVAAVNSGTVGLGDTDRSDITETALLPLDAKSSPLFES
jgi:hypothetical protein